jgi:subtilisin family serine protease
MSDLKEYTVTAPSMEVTDSIWDDLVTDGPTPETIPDRAVEVANERPTNPRNTTYLLTDEEAEKLRQDPRVEDVQDLSLFKIHSKASFGATFDKTSTQTGAKGNWGLLRHTSRINTYGTSLLDPGGTYDYVLDGTNVDIVVIDSGIQLDHPEFKVDGSQASRIRNIDWFEASGVSGTMPDLGQFYTDYDGHGTHVAGTVAGLSYGWARNANIYSIKLNGLQGAGDPSPGLDASTAFDVLIGWHNNKVIQNPTVVVNSWGYGVYWRDDLQAMSFGLGEFDTTFAINGGNYRGTAWVTPVRDATKGLIGSAVQSNTYLMPFRVAAVDADIATGAAAGIIFCNAGGNESHKIDVFGGVDYDNRVFTDFGTYYYHRGMSPSINTDEASFGFTVGAMDFQTNSGVDRKASYSNSGPGITAYAAGSRIISSTSNINANNSNISYFADSAYKQELQSGTSMAAPQIAGMAALVLQMHLDWSPKQVVDFIKYRSIDSALYSTGLDNDYSVSDSLHGGTSKVPYIEMAQQRVFSIFSQ